MCAFQKLDGVEIEKSERILAIQVCVCYNLCLVYCFIFNIITSFSEQFITLIWLVAYTIMY